MRIGIAIAMVLIISCQNQEKYDAKYPDNIFSIIQKGDYQQATYSFCGPTVEYIPYTYRVGTWTFYTKENHKIAEGQYDLEKITIWESGGCPYDKYVNRVDLNKWKFWDVDSRSVHSNERLIKMINLRNDRIYDLNNYGTIKDTLIKRKH